jgi:hypothetical protein
MEFLVSVHIDQIRLMVTVALCTSNPMYVISSIRPVPHV